jgi:hypothetical protein
MLILHPSSAGTALVNLLPFPGKDARTWLFNE